MVPKSKKEGNKDKVPAVGGAGGVDRVRAVWINLDLIEELDFGPKSNIQIQ